MWEGTGKWGSNVAFCVAASKAMIGDTSSSYTELRAITLGAYFGGVRGSDMWEGHVGGVKDISK